MVGARRMYGLFTTSVVRFEKSGDGVSTTFVFSVCSAVISCTSVCVVVKSVVVVFLSIWLPKFVSQAVAYYSLCKILRSGTF